MSATDELRRILDERGIEYETDDAQVSETEWYYVTKLRDGYRDRWTYEEPPDCDLLVSYQYDLGAEDAIAATVGRDERENAALKAELDRVLGEHGNRDGLLQLPLDADRVPIFIGDVMESDYITRTEVAAVGIKCFFAWSNIDRRWHQYEANQFRHHAPDTWERIIEDAVNVHGNGFNPCWTDERDALVARCKALCERTKEDA